ncbi:MAG TPA: regulator, partial [Burkholderiaceae bacterium]
FEHPVNEAREARGLPAVNSIWFHAQGAAQPVRSPFARVFSDAAATRGLALSAGVETGTPPASFGALATLAGATHANPGAGLRGHAGATAGGTAGATSNGAARGTLVELDPFSAPYIEQDWARWNHAFAAVQTDWFEPALAALQSGQLGELGLTLCGDTGSVTLTVTRGDLRKFWRRRVLASLFIE